MAPEDRQAGLVNIGYTVAEAASRIRIAIQQTTEVQLVQRLALTPQQISIIRKTGAYDRAADTANTGVEFTCLRDMLDKPDFMFGIPNTCPPHAKFRGSFPYDVFEEPPPEEGTVRILPPGAGPNPPWEVFLTLRASEMEYVRTRTELGHWAVSFTKTGSSAGTLNPESGVSDDPWFDE